MDFRLLGPVEACVDERVVRLGGPRERKVLAALLLRQGRAVSAEFLTEVLWADAPPATSRAQVHNSVAALRRGLAAAAADTGPRITGSGGAFRLTLGQSRLDVRQFAEERAEAERLLSTDRFDRAAEALRRALELWRGPALDGVGSEALLGEAQLLDEQRMTTLEQRIDLDLRLGRHRSLIGELAALCGQHPLRERLIGQQMLALYRSDRQADALEVFLRCRAVLDRELGVAPGRHLSGLYEQILRADEQLNAPAPGEREPEAAPAPHPARRGPVPRQLPADVGDFVGHEALAAELVDLLADCAHTVPVAALVGMGGIGKSGLALRVAHRLRDAFPDGQLYADLRGIRQPRRPASQVLAGFVTALGHEGPVPADPDELGVLYRSLLADRRVLVVLDDAADAAHIRPLLPGYPGCAALVTSRHRLASPDGIRTRDVPPLTPEQARALLAGIVGHERTAAEPEATDAVVAVCEGVPLAVRIVAARLTTRPDWSVADMAQRLERSGASLDELAGAEHSVRRTLLASYAALGPDPARCLRLLGLWEGGEFGLAEFAASTGLPDDAADTALGTLVESHLVETPRVRRYRLHELVRRFARERTLADDDEQDREAALRRLLGWYLTAADLARRVLRPVRDSAPPRYEGPGSLPGFRDAAAALEWLDSARANLTAVTGSAALSGMDDLVWYAPLVLADICSLRGHWAEWIELCRLGLEAANALPDRKPRAVVGNLAGVAHLRSGQLPEAAEHFARAAQSARAAGEELLEGFCLNSLGGCYHDLGENEKAAEALTAASAIAERTGSASLKGVALSVLAHIDAEEDRLHSAARRLEEAERIYSSEGRPDALGQILSPLADILRRLGRPADAEATLRRAVQAHREAGNRPAEAATLGRLGDAHRAVGRIEEARAEWTEAIRLLGADDPAATDLRARLEELDRVGESAPPA